MVQNQDLEELSQPPNYPGRLAIQQRVLPAYRIEFFDTLALSCQGGLSVFAGQPRPDESIQTVRGLENARYSPARNIHLGEVGSPYYLCWQRGIVNWLEEWQPDALILEANQRYLRARRAAGWMHNRGRPVIGWGLGSPKTGSDKNSLLIRSQNLNRKHFFGLFDGLIAYSRQGADEYRTLGFPQERVFVAPNAVIRRPSAPPPIRPASFLARPSILFVGRLQARKRVDNLMSVCSDLPAPLQPDLVIVGDGPDRERLQQLASSIYPRTEFVGAIHNAELAPYFDHADLLVLPGTGGLAVQEAMGHALPVIVAEGDGTQDDLVRPGNGWRVQPNDIGSLMEALMEALSDPEKLRKMGWESYRIVQKEANIETMIAAFLEALSKIHSGDTSTFDR